MYAVPEGRAGVGNIALCWLEVGHDDVPRVAWGGQAYHAPCGNLWFNRDALSGRAEASSHSAHGAGSTAPPTTTEGGDSAGGDDDDGFGGFAQA
jgi:hypothetical protein